MQLDGQTVIVTGGASGLGEATARRLNAAGAHVAIFDFNPKAGAELAVELNGIFQQVDVCDERAVSAALREVEAHFGVPRVLVNCAGLWMGCRVLTKEGPHPLDSFRRVVDVNLTGTFNCLRLFAERLSHTDPVEDGERGVIINTASTAAYEGQSGQAAYAASKAGVVGLTLPLARDLARLGVRICAISPGTFATAAVRSGPPKLLESLRALFQFPARFGEPPEFAELVHQICVNRMLNGTVIRLDAAVRLA